MNSKIIWIVIYTYDQCSICQKTVGVERRRCRGGEVWEGDDLIFFHFKMVHSGAFSYNSKVLFCNQMQGKVRHHGILGD